jgi:hypothetical protein
MQEEGAVEIFVFAAVMHYTALKLNLVTVKKGSVE